MLSKHDLTYIQRDVIVGVRWADSPRNTTIQFGVQSLMSEYTICPTLVCMEYNSRCTSGGHLGQVYPSVAFMDKQAILNNVMVTVIVQESSTDVSRNIQVTTLLSASKHSIHREQLPLMKHDWTCLEALVFHFI